MHGTRVLPLARSRAFVLVLGNFTRGDPSVTDY